MIYNYQDYSKADNFPKGQFQGPKDFSLFQTRIIKYNGK